MQNKQSGFTLIELMVTLAVAGILMSIAIPNYQTFILNSRITAQANEFMAAVGLTRSEAIKRATKISICKSANTTVALPTCTTSGNWAQGWIIFTDGGTQGIKDGTDAIIQVRGPLAGTNTFIGNTNVVNYIAYGASGFGTQMGTVSLCPPSPAAVVGRDIVISSTGRARVQKPPAIACI